jgi:hypothetical protein
VTPQRLLTRPITLFGLVVGLCAAMHWFRPNLESVVASLILISIITVSCHILGRWLTRSIKAWQGKTLLVSALSGVVFVGGVGIIADLAGARSGSTVSTALGLGVAGGFLGLLLALPFLLPLAIVMKAARRIGRARPLSVIDRSDRRMLWLAWAGALLVWSAASLWWRARSGPFSAGFLIVCFGYWLAHNRVELGRLRAFSVAGQRRRELGAAPIDARDRRLTDYGIGDEEWEQWESPFAADNPYREGPELRRVIRGDRALASAALVELGRLACVGLVLSVAVLAAHLWS